MKTAALTLTLLLIAAIFRPMFIAPVHAAGIGEGCITNAECVTGLMCDYTINGPDYRTCQDLQLNITSATTTDSQITAVVGDNNNATTNFFGCIGTTCNAQPTTNTNFWRSLGTGGTLNYTGLRPGRTYQFNTSATVNGSIGTASRTGLTTWPGYGFTPTETNAGCDGTTRLCKRNISWTTPFPGDSSVVYGPDAPVWSLESNPRDSAANISALTSTVNGHIWGVGWYAGKIIHRDPSGVWAPQTSSTVNSLVSVSSVDGLHVWAVGLSGAVISTQNGGQNWATTPPFTVGSFTNVTATLDTTAWATTKNEVYFFDGSSWQLKLNDPSGDFQQVVSVDNKEVWVVSYSGSIRHTRDGHLVWGSGTPPVWDTVTPSAGDRFTSISTLDGKTLWASGNNSNTAQPILYRSQNGGTWVSIPQIQSVSARVSNIQQINQDSFWFSNITGVGKFDYNGGTPLISVYPDPGTQIGSDVLALVVDKGNNILAAGAQQNISRYAMPTSSILQSAVTSTTNHSLQLTGLAPNTTYYYSAESTGTSVTSGAFGGSFTTPILDTVKPTVTITAPAPATNVCSVTINGTAADTTPGTVQSVRVTVDANPAITATGTTTWSLALPCAQVTPGSHTITAIANDGTNDSNPATATFVFDNTNPTVTISAPTPVTTSSISANGTASDALDQVSKVEVVVNGTGSRVNVPITAGATVNWSLSGINLVAGTNTIVVFATDRAGNETSASKTVIYNVPTFTIAAQSPTSQTVAAGSSALFTILVSAVNGFTGDVVPSATVTPAGLSPLFTPQQAVLGTQNSAVLTMIVPSANGGASGPYTIVISGTNGSVTKTTQVTLTLTATPDFTLSVNPASRTVVAGTSAVYDLVVSGSSTYTMPSGGIDWTTGILPSGVTATFGAMSGQPSNGGTGTVKLTLTPSAVVPPGASISITASDDTLSHSVTVGLTATPPPDISLIIEPATASTTAGSNNPGAYNVTVAALNGFGGTVRLGLGSTPTDTAIRGTFSENDFIPTAAGNQITLNVFADTMVACAPVPPTAPAPCSYGLTITASSGVPPSGITKTASATLLVTPDVVPPVINGITASASDTNVTISWATNEPANSRFDLFTDAARTNPIGFKEVTTTYCLTTCHVLSYDGVLTPLTTYYYTITSADQAYPSGNSATVSSDTNGALSFRTQAAPDNSAPTITITSPAGGTSVRGVVTISGQATDNNPMSQVKISMTGPTGATGLPSSTIDCTGGTTCPFSLNWNTMNGTSPNGGYILTVIALSSTGPAFTTTANRSFNVDNDTTPPTIECLSGQTICEPIATGLTCTGGSCSVIIKWRTNESSTSEVEYGLAVDCDQQVQRPDGTFVSCAYTNAKRYDDVNDNPTGSLPNFTEHSVTLNNLSPDQLYHYRVTSCNISNLCTN